jgi:mono/diheme cytochrome c family protein
MNSFSNQQRDWTSAVRQERGLQAAANREERRGFGCAHCSLACCSVNAALQCVLAALFLFTRTILAAESGAKLDTHADSFIKDHCLRCHGPEKVKGDLRLDQLETDFAKPSVFERWREVVARTQSGEMPPKKEPRPPAAQAQSFVRSLTARLDEASAKHRAAGRTVLRRLNRVEYENTVNDLFGTSAMVKEMLPEDAVAQGFDNVGAALNISPVLIERYLDAADAVITAALAPVHKLESTKQRYDFYASLPSWFANGVMKQDDGVVLFRGGATDLRQFKAPAPGRYKFRLAVSARNSPTPLPLGLLLGNFVVSGNYARHLGYFDAPPGPEPTVIEVTEHLAVKNDTIKLMPVALPFVYLNQNNMADYPGPGLKVHWVEVEGPFPEAWPTERYQRVFGDADPKKGTLADAEKLIRALLPRAFRRPVAEGEEKPFVAVAAKSLEMGQPFEAALRAGYKAVLSSPKFLYFREPAGPLDDHALASRLSYFLWSTMPDSELLALAAKGELRKPEVLRAQVERMLKHPKARAFTENFTGQWLSLRDIQATTPDKALYPEFEELLEWSMVRETHLFFEELLKQNLSVRNFVDSDFAMLNARLATHYGIPDVQGVAFRKVALRPEWHRGGVLTHASVLKVTANGTTTSPVLRGVWVLDRILGRPVPPPPPNVPAVEPDIRGATTIREQLAQHRATENCAGCHARIDPPGFALENYDVIGGWREKYRVVAERKNWVNNRTGPLARYLAAWQYGLGPAVEAGDELPDGRKFADIAEFKKLLLEHPEQIARCLTEKLVTYATGQPVGFGDHAAVGQILAEAKATDYGLRSLVHAVVASELFRSK